MTNRAKWEELEGLILLEKEESEKTVKDSSMSYTTREFYLRRLDFLKEVEVWMEELNDKQFDDALEEEQHAKERQERIETGQTQPVPPEGT